MSNEEIKLLIDKSKRFIESSELLFNAKDYDSAVSRVYYAMYYSTEAILLTKNLLSKSHSGLIALFGDHFIKTNIFSKEMGRQLNRAYDKRLIGDYGTTTVIDKETAENTLKMGQNFIGKIIKYLEDKKFL